MTEHGQFDTNATALIQRIQAHEKYGSNDLNQWIFSHINLVEGLSILELGCGIGKQTLPMAQMIGDTGSIVAVDISADALNSLNEQAKNLGVLQRIRLICCGLDELDEYLHEHIFDRVLSSYALYYARNPSKVFHTIRSVLKSGGICFFCGPSRNNNIELRNFHYSLKGEATPIESGAPMFMEETGQQLAREMFSEVKIVEFQNALRFDSPEALYIYWSSYNLYDERLDEAFKHAAADHFRTNLKFETSKRVIGVYAVK
jgi:ubiquinone/menaquinone biosynthesis C-methylase UbiE